MYVDAGGDEPSYIEGYEANYTYNVAPMFSRALPERPTGRSGIRQLNGMRGGAAKELLTLAIGKMEAYPSEYKVLNPSNGWGDYDSALELLRELRRWCEAAPDARMRVS
jgi:hypothetical protein